MCFYHWELYITILAATVGTTQNRDTIDTQPETVTATII